MSRRVRKVHAVAFPVLACLYVIVQLLGGVYGSQDWAPWTDFPFPLAEPCILTLISQANVLGGRTTTGISTSVLAVDVANPLVSKELSPPLPVAAFGQFCARAENSIFVTSQASPMSPAMISNFDVFVSDFSFSPQVGYYTGSPWRSIGRGRYNRTRAGIGAAGDKKFDYSVIIFGGVVGQSNTFIPVIDAFNLSAQRWNVIGTMSQDPGFPTHCDCQVGGHYTKMVVVCLLCQPTPAQRGLAKVMVFDAKRGYFDNSRAVVVDFGPNFAAFNCLPMSHFVLITVDMYNETNPRLYYYDLFTSQLQLIVTADFPTQRTQGNVFALGFNLYYAGGVTPNGSLSSEVDTVPALPSITAVPEHTNYTYYVNQNITLSIDRCTPGLLVRLATSPSCMTVLPQTEDTPCQSLAGGDGQVVIGAPPSPYPEGATICLSLGQCTNVVADRLPCANQPNPDFETCLYNYCCWDSVNQSCFQFLPGAPDTRYFYQVNLAPLFIAALPTSDQNTILAFLQSAGGIATCAVVGVLLIVTALGIIHRYAWRQSTTPDDGEFGSAHPLDQHGKYRILGKLGQGGFGTVYLVSRRSDGERFAMKYIVCKDEEERDYAIKEFELLYNSQGHPNMIRLIEMFMNWTTAEEFPSSLNSQLDTAAPRRSAPISVHRLIPKFRSSLRSNDTNSSGSGSGGRKKPAASDTLTPLLQIAPRYICIVMDFCPEGDLAKYILHTYAKGGRVPEAMVLDVVLRQCCSVLMHLHSLSPPIVHRDLKPENLLLRSNGTEVVLTDFGLAQQIEKSYLTTRAGSLHYVAPECWKRHYTAAVDLWALGCIAYGMCTGRVTADTARVMFSDAREANFESAIRSDLAGYSEKLQNIVMGMLQVTPSKRFSAPQILQMLGEEEGSHHW